MSGQTETVVITAHMTDEAASQLAQFIEGSCFDTFYEYTENYLPHAERQRRAYLMIDGIHAIQKALTEVGYAPQ